MKKDRIANAALTLVFIMGLCLLLYPSVSNAYNALHQSRAIKNYTQTIENTDAAKLDAIFAEAEAYNAALIGQKNTRFEPDEAAHALYMGLLSLTDSGAMGYIEIPRINVELTVYHTVSEPVLRTGVGHFEGSSLPTGGAGTHAVLSGHRGLPSARLFSDMDRVQTGDVFFLHILNRVMAYEVDEVHIVDPTDISNLGIDPEADLCTLVTCTPYGINSHRLLVRGHRVDYEKARSITVKAEATLLSSLYLLPVMAAPLLLFLLILLLFPKKKRRR